MDKLRLNEAGRYERVMLLNVLIALFLYRRWYSEDELQLATKRKDSQVLSMLRLEMELI